MTGIIPTNRPAFLNLPVDKKAEEGPATVSFAQAAIIVALIVLAWVLVLTPLLLRG